MLVSQILMEKGRDVVVIGPKATLFEAANILTRNRIGALLVQGLAGELAGISASHCGQRRGSLMADILTKSDSASL